MRRDLPDGVDADRTLPSCSTCHNYLKLPACVVVVVRASSSFARRHRSAVVVVGGSRGALCCRCGVMFRSNITPHRAVVVCHPPSSLVVASSSPRRRLASLLSSFVVRPPRLPSRPRCRRLTHGDRGRVWRVPALIGRLCCGGDRVVLVMSRDTRARPCSRRACGRRSSRGRATLRSRERRVVLGRSRCLRQRPRRMSRRLVVLITHRVSVALCGTIVGAMVAWQPRGPCLLSREEACRVRAPCACRVRARVHSSSRTQTRPCPASKRRFATNTSQYGKSAHLQRKEEVRSARVWRHYATNDFGHRHWKGPFAGARGHARGGR